VVSRFVSGRRRKPLTIRRLAIAIAVCAALAAIVAVVAVLLGRGTRGLELLGLGAFDESSPDHPILAVRVPRVLATLLVGAALAGAGCALQALLRNPLAEPFTLGISSGASLGAVLAIRFGLEGALGTAGLGGAAMIGAMATLAVVMALARVGRQLPPATLVLAGVSISMFCGAASLLVQYTTDFTDTLQIVSWMVGGFDAIWLVRVKWAAVPILAGLGVLLVYGRELNALAAGDEAAASVGVAVARTQFVVFAVASLLVGAAIAIAGPIGFVGLVVPHALRAILGPDHRVLLPASMFGGALVLTVCDTVARTVMTLTHLPTGAVTPALGVPVFVAILIGQKRRAAMWGST
jgi:iron complex transport system permease protein